MKKLLSLLIALSVLAGTAAIVGCGSDSAKKDKDKDKAPAPAKDKDKDKAP